MGKCKEYVEKFEQWILKLKIKNEKCLETRTAFRIRGQLDNIKMPNVNEIQYTGNQRDYIKQ